MAKSKDDGQPYLSNVVRGGVTVEVPNGIAHASGDGGGKVPPEGHRGGKIWPRKDWGSNRSGE